MDEKAVLPCPFCGSQRTIQGGDDKVCGIYCQDCGAGGPNGYQSDVRWNDRAPLSPGSTGETEVTETMIEAGHEAARAWTDRYMDGSEFVNWQQGLPDIYRAMLSAAGER